uniref:DNA replication complex GINS protein PSF2 n=1 Tax=Panagrolaimus sp. PS1159 TaxID=55785 RepID=A0AC35F9Q4_9BILA
MDLEQCNFLTEDLLITILPRMRLEVEKIDGILLEFEPRVPIEVPVWIAMFLRKKQKCTVIPPVWLTVDELNRISQAEADSTVFTEIPERFFELSHILITQCQEDLENLEQLRTLVKDIWDKRSSKMRTSTMGLFEAGTAGHIKLNGITQFEIAHSRDFILDASSTLGKLSNVYLSIDEY